MMANEGESKKDIHIQAKKKAPVPRAADFSRGKGKGKDRKSNAELKQMQALVNEGKTYAQA